MFLDTLRRTLRVALAGAPLLLLTQPFRALADSNGFNNAGFVYVMTNQASANSILVYQRAASGSLKELEEVYTQGMGTGTGSDPLGSQGSVTLSDDGHLLFAANAGSNEVSSLAVTPAGLTFVSKSPSGGTMPVSIATRGDIVFVLNAGGTPNVTGFRMDAYGHLAMIPGSKRALPGGANSAPAQVGIRPDGEVLVVTEKNTNQIDLFPIDSLGNIGSASTVPSNGATPFAFTFGHDQTLIVSEAAAATVSSYRIETGASSLTLQTLTKSLPDGGAATCWIVIEIGGRLAFAVNAGSNTISSIFETPSGQLQLVASSAATTPSGTGPIDEALTRNGGFLYVLGTGNGSLTGFSVSTSGQLSQVASVTGLPLSIQGIAAQ